ncbi:hypothetical protein [Marinimicrobium sp. ABcell2]|uniref:hypothetical protein n=1 Tax=Marinimicrobium sp. ABcell2 TaxID=3069751 RepID=UPI0027B2D251|nr:hypothetical protein [Marinimicrobium sp. ABcell2]MDQ2077376.1 hypothetical protein [Marinimicrobium sp. ABcell2]
MKTISGIELFESDEEAESARRRSARRANVTICLLPLPVIGILIPLVMFGLTPQLSSFVVLSVLPLLLLNFVLCKQGSKFAVQAQELKIVVESELLDKLEEAKGIPEAEVAVEELKKQRRIPRYIEAAAILELINTELRQRSRERFVGESSGSRSKAR